jgi:hypothetical protein
MVTGISTTLLRRSQPNASHVVEEAVEEVPLSLAATACSITVDAFAFLEHSDQDDLEPINS